MIHEIVVGPLSTRAILIYSQKQAILVDPGYGSFKMLLPFLEERNLSLSSILLTHSHYDHIADLSHFASRFKDAEIYVHPEDLPNVIRPGSDGIPLSWPIQGIDTPTKELKEGMEIHFQGDSWIIFETPGHTRGSCIFYNANQKILITGDLIFANGIGRTDLPTSIPEKMEDSLRKLLKFPGGSQLIPGHGPICSLKESLHGLFYR